MKGSKLYAVAILYLITATGVFGQDRPFTVAGDKDEAPFGFFDDNKVFCGVYVDMLAEALKRLDVPLSFSGYPWARAQDMVKTLKADAMITVMTDARKEFTVKGLVPMTTLTWVAFANKNNQRLHEILAAKTLEDFSSFKILDYVGDGWGENNLKNLDVDRSGNFSQQLLKLANNRGDVFIQMDIVTQYTLSNLKKDSKITGLDLSQIVASTNALDKKEFFLLVHKDSPYVSILPKLDKVITDMKADGSISRIMQKYEIQ